MASELFNHPIIKKVRDKKDLELLHKLIIRALWELLLRLIIYNYII